MKCYTRTGDQGETCIFGGRVDKHDERIDAIGAFDELNSFLGAARAFSENKETRRILHELENDIFSIGAEIAGVDKKVVITSRHVEQLETLIDKIDEKLPKQSKFIIPSGTQAAMMLNIARAVARRAERALVKLDRQSKISPKLLSYANRLSSLLHVLMRFENMKENIEEKHPVYYNNEMRIL